ncbi:unnamed protein product [Onchocerca flexuosa]|uniref:Uncharacterized protein n=1 Tax=Onchocerca flexuosa TaxID=387005 RepID=A0A183I284_9BILA|nr:unnamed protein product [Onchocerca flexuosa]
MQIQLVQAQLRSATKDQNGNSRRFTSPMGIIVVAKVFVKRHSTMALSFDKMRETRVVRCPRKKVLPAEHRLRESSMATLCSSGHIILTLLCTKSSSLFSLGSQECDDDENDAREDVTVSVCCLMG